MSTLGHVLFLLPFSRDFPHSACIASFLTTSGFSRAGSTGIRRDVKKGISCNPLVSVASSASSPPGPSHLLHRPSYSLRRRAPMLLIRSKPTLWRTHCERHHESRSYLEQRESRTHLECESRTHLECESRTHVERESRAHTLIRGGADRRRSVHQHAIRYSLPRAGDIVDLLNGDPRPQLYAGRFLSRTRAARHTRARRLVKSGQKFDSVCVGKRAQRSSERKPGYLTFPVVELRSERGSTSTARVELFPEVPLGVPPPGRRPRFT
jgi:hypothetical protein